MIKKSDMQMWGICSAVHVLGEISSQENKHVEIKKSSVAASDIPSDATNKDRSERNPEKRDMVIRSRSPNKRSVHK